MGPLFSPALRNRIALASALVALLALGGCATRPVNPPITQADPSTGYRLATRQAHFKDQETFVIPTRYALTSMPSGCRVPPRLDRARRIVVFVVNSVAAPPTQWDESKSAPAIVSTLVQASGVLKPNY